MSVRWAVPTYQIEMLWTCRICGASDNRGLARHCTSCGKPKDERDEERFPDDRSEASALSGDSRRKALAGPDWNCKFCSTLQNSLGKCCSHCGADRNTGSRSWQTEEVSVTEDVKTGVKTTTRKTTKVRGRVMTKDVDWKSVDEQLQEMFPPIPRAGKFRVDPEPPKTDLSSFSNEEQKNGAVLIPKVVHKVSSEEKNSETLAGTVEFIPDTGSYRDPPKIFIKKLPLHIRAADWARGIHRGFLRAGAFAGLLLLASLVLWLVFRTRVVDVKVSSIHWEHSVVVERCQVTPKEGWSPDDGAFDIEDRGQRIHHYDHVRVGSHQESYPESYTCGETCTTVRGSCYTTSRTCKSNKNGTATCTGGDRVCNPDTRSCSPKTCTRTAYRTVDDYEDQPRYSEWRAWKVWEWHYNRTVRKSGSSTETSWSSEEELQPSSISQGEQERNHRVEEYEVVFSDSKDSWTIKPKTEDDFRRFPPGSRYKIKVGIANGVTILSQNGTTSDY